MNTKQKVAAFKLSFCMACVDAMKREYPEKSRIWLKLDNLEEHLGRVLDEFRIEAFATEDLDKASQLFDVMEKKVMQMYNGKRPARRDERGRFAGGVV